MTTAINSAKIPETPRFDPKSYSLKFFTDIEKLKEAQAKGTIYKFIFKKDEEQIYKTGFLRRSISQTFSTPENARQQKKRRDRLSKLVTKVCKAFEFMQITTKNNDFGPQIPYLEQLPYETLLFIRKNIQDDRFKKGTFLKDLIFALGQKELLIEKMKPLLEALESENPTIYIETFLRYEPGRQFLDNFAQNHQVIENLEFIKAVQEYRNLPLEEKPKKVEAILDKFIREEAPLEINIKSSTRKNILKSEFSPEIFDTAYNTIVTMLYNHIQSGPGIEEFKRSLVNP
jgi:Regulator of G protein signaling domain